MYSLIFFPLFPRLLPSLRQDSSVPDSPLALFLLIPLNDIIFPTSFHDSDIHKRYLQLIMIIIVIVTMIMSTTNFLCPFETGKKDLPPPLSDSLMFNEGRRDKEDLSRLLIISCDLFSPCC